MKNLSKKFTSKLLGYADVDSGLIWIGDPCYILHHSQQGQTGDAGLPDSLGKDWSDFCSKLDGGNFFVAKSFTHQTGYKGLGVCMTTNYGDGSYPVIGFFAKGEDRPSAVLIDFNNVFDVDNMEVFDSKMMSAREQLYIEQKKKEAEEYQRSILAEIAALQDNKKPL